MGEKKKVKNVVDRDVMFIISKIKWGAEGDFSAYITPKECRILLKYLEAK